MLDTSDSSTAHEHSPVLTVFEGLDDVDLKLATSRAMERIKTFAGQPAHIVMEGEPGAGKRFHAMLLHEQRTGGTVAGFVEVTQETSQEMLRAVLFDEDRRLLEGKIGKAAPSLEGYSMLFLHGVGEFSIMHQTMLSRFLIEQQSRQRSPYVNTSVIVSTTTPWKELLQGKVLIESFARSVEHFEVCRIPPLRDRLDELPSLVHIFLGNACLEEGAVAWRITREVFDQLASREWRGNLAELKYIIEDAAVKSPGSSIVLPVPFVDEIDLALEMFRTIEAGKRLAIEESLASFEKAVIERALNRYNFDLRRTARMLSMTEPNLTYRIKKFNIYIPQQK
jgi:DNA-binding NtrC family response regulator